MSHKTNVSVVTSVTFNENENSKETNSVTLTVTLTVTVTWVTATVHCVQLIMTHSKGQCSFPGQFNCEYNDHQSLIQQQHYDDTELPRLTHSSLSEPKGHS